MDRDNHYETAFESYLHRHRVGYVPVDESRRVLLDDAPIKSLDFLVFGRDGARLVIDVKGRRFPGGPRKKPRRVWESWSFREDVEGLERWADLAGPGFRALLVFAYSLHASVELGEGVPDLHAVRNRRYLFRAVEVGEYRKHMRVRSPRWGTVCLPTDVFRKVVRPVSDFVLMKEPEEVPF